MFRCHLSHDVLCRNKETAPILMSAGACTFYRYFPSVTNNMSAAHATGSDLSLSKFKLLPSRQLFLGRCDQPSSATKPTTENCRLVFLTLPQVVTVCHACRSFPTLDLSKCSSNFIQRRNCGLFSPGDLHLVQQQEKAEGDTQPKF